MTETQLNLLREWFREEVEYLIKKNTSQKNRVKLIMMKIYQIIMPTKHLMMWL
jgi:hypothetical protein